MVFYTVFNSISIILWQQVYLSKLSWSSFNQYSALSKPLAAFQHNHCLHVCKIYSPIQSNKKNSGNFPYLNGFHRISVGFTFWTFPLTAPCHLLIGRKLSQTILENRKQDNSNRFKHYFCNIMTINAPILAFLDFLFISIAFLTHSHTMTLFDTPGKQAF